MEVETIKEHLAEYKDKVLNISANGIWKKNNKQYAHILPEILKEKNILNSDYHKMIIDEIANNNIKLHSDFHHLNSSQALCFNLFYPIFFENIFVTLFNKNRKSEIVEEYKFEYIENNNENTNFDLFVKTNEKRYYFEIKYTEKEFGKEKSDDRHIKKYNAIYKERLNIFSNVSMEIFFEYYQIFRNIIYNNGYNVFVFPKNRIDLENTIIGVIENHCTKEQQEHIIILSIEEIVKEILVNNGDNEKLINHYNSFMKKYII
jgi:hypothetical protein